MFEVDFSRSSNEAVKQLANEKLLSGLEEWERHIWQFIDDWFNQSIASINIFTSGSTGAPKKITHSKAAMLNSAKLTCNALDLKPGDNALLCLPVNKIGGMMMIIRCIYNQMNMVCIKSSSKPLSSLPQVHIDFAAFTPMQFHEITISNSVFTKAEAIDKIILGGEDVREELLAEIKHLNNTVYATFGMTETISHIALKRLSGPSPDKNFTVLEGIEVSVDNRNCLVIEAPLLGQPSLITNDVVRIINKKEFQWLGRADNVINSGGVKIHPEEIEQQLSEVINHPFFITALPDKVLGQKLVLALEVEAIESLKWVELKKSLLQLEKLHRPKEILLVKRFERTSNGKIKRKESLERIAARIDVSA